MSVRYREILPAPILAPYVQCFWELAASAGERHRVLPDGAMDIVFSVDAGPARVVGPMTRAITIEEARAAWVVGVRFRPGAAIDLLGVASHELCDANVPVAEVWGADGRSLDRQLADARNAGAATASIERELVSRAGQARRPNPRVARAVAKLSAVGGELPVAAIAMEVGVGERQLERLFIERVGYGPKMFSRVVRLRRCTSAIGAGHANGSIASWASLAIHCGYADQAHLVREFRALTGVTPAMYARQRAMSEIDNPAT